jgi:hypothetical protein
MGGGGHGCAAACSAGDSGGGGVKTKFDKNSSLNSLLGWKKDPPPYPTSLVERVNTALELPIKDLTWKQIRMLIGQNFGLEYLMPWAIDALEKRPLYSIEFYEGDLMVACLQVKREYWINNFDQWQRLKAVLSNLDSAMKSINDVRERFENQPFQP